jgi:hypothetical protein
VLLRCAELVQVLLHGRLDVRELFAPLMRVLVIIHAGSTCSRPLLFVANFKILLSDHSEFDVHQVVQVDGFLSDGRLIVVVVLLAIDYLEQVLAPPLEIVQVVLDECECLLDETEHAVLLGGVLGFLNVMPVNDMRRLEQLILVLHFVTVIIELLLLLIRSLLSLLDGCLRSIVASIALQLVVVSVHTRVVQVWLGRLLKVVINANVIYQQGRLNYCRVRIRVFYLLYKFHLL